MQAGWDITGTCNLNCLYCYNRQFYAQRKQSDLNTKTIKHILESIKNSEVKIHFLQFLGGEPFLRNDLVSIMQECDKYGIDYGVATNGTVITQRKIRELCDLSHLKNICFSIDCFSSKISNRLCGEGTWQKSVNVLSELLTIKSNYLTSFKLGIESVLTNLNKNYIEETVEWASMLGIDYWSCDLIKMPYHANISSNLILSHKDIFNASRKLGLIAKRLPHFNIRIDWGLPLLKSYINKIAGRDICGGIEKRCTAVKNTVWIGNTGCVQPCAYVNSFNEFQCKSIHGFILKKQNHFLTEASLDNIIQSSYFKKFYRFVNTISAKRKYELCNICEYHDICDLCPLDIMQYAERCTMICYEFKKWRDTNE